MSSRAHLHALVVLCAAITLVPIAAPACAQRSGTQ